MTPTLKSAGASYTRFVKALDHLNMRANKSARKGFESLTGLIESFESLPDKAVAGYRKAVDAIGKRMKPITQTFTFALDGKARKDFTSLISTALGTIFGKATLKIARNKEGLGASESAMVGKLDLPHFKEGGMVTQGAGKGIDDVLAVLGKGEMILPADASKQLIDLVGQTQNAEGHFEKLPTEIKKAYAEIVNLSKSLEILKTQAELGLDPEAAEKFGIGLKEANKKSLDLAKSLMKAGLNTAWTHKAVDAVKELRNNFAQLAEREEETIVFTDKLLGTAFGKQRWDSLHKQLKEGQENYDKFGEAVKTGGEHIGITNEKLGSTYDNFLAMNKQLGLSKDELAAYRGASQQYANSIDGATYSMEQFSDAQKDLLASHFDKEMSMKLAPAVASFAQSTGVGREAVAELANELSFTFHMSGKEIENYLANLRATGTAAGVVPDALFSAMKKSGEAMSGYLQTLGPEQSKTVLESTMKLAAVLEGQSKGLGEHVTSLIGEAVSGNAEAYAQLALATGKDLSEIKSDLEKGDLTGFLQGMQTQLKGLADNKDNLAALKSFAEATGMSSEQIQKMTLNTSSLIPALQKVQGVNVSTADSLGYLVKQSAGTTTWIEQFKNGMDRFTQSAPGVAAVFSFFKEYSPQTIFSLIGIGKEALNAGSGLLGLAKSGLQWAGVMSKGAGAAAAATEATGALGGAGKGLGSVFTGVGSVVKDFFLGLFEVIGAAGKGIGQFIYGILSGIGQGIAGLGAGIGGAIAEIMTGMAAGIAVLAPALVALYPAIPVILVLELGIVALGAALWLAAPALDVVVKGAVALATVLGGVFVDAIKAVGSVVVQVLGKAMDTLLSLFSLNPLQVAAIGLALIPFALGLSAMGIGLAAFGLGALTALPGLIGLAAAFALFGAMSGGAGVGGVISSLVDSFQVDPGKMDAALRSMDNAVSFIAKFMALSAVLTGAGILTGLGGIVDSVLGFFGINSPLQQLVKQGKGVASTIESLMGSFASLADSTAMKSADSIIATLGSSTMFVKNLAPLISATKELGDLTAQLDDGFFTNGPLSKLDNTKGKFFGVVSDLINGAKALSVSQPTANITVSQADSARRNADDKQDYEAQQVELQKDTNELLKNILDSMQSGRGAKATNYTGVQGGSNSRGELSRNILAGNY